MARISPADIDKWDPSQIDDVYQACKQRSAACDDLGTAVNNGTPSVTGQTGSAIDASTITHTNTLNTHSENTGNAAAAVSAAEQEVIALKARLNSAREQIVGSGFDMDENTGKITNPSPNMYNGQDVGAVGMAQLQAEVNSILADAEGVDHDLTLALQEAAGSSGSGSSGEQVGMSGGAGSTGRVAAVAAISRALDAKGIADPVARANWTRGMMTLIERESGFNARAVNRSDSNAKGAVASDGAPDGASRGLTQTVPGTFAANHQAGTANDIYDPVANVAASMNYVQKSYGVSADGSDLAAKVQQANPDATPRGY